MYTKEDVMKANDLKDFKEWEREMMVQHCQRYIDEISPSMQEALLNCLIQKSSTGKTMKIMVDAAVMVANGTDIFVAGADKSKAEHNAKCINRMVKNIVPEGHKVGGINTHGRDSSIHHYFSLD